LRAEADRIEREGAIKREEIELLDFAALAAFWGSELGCRIREKAAWVNRELPFTFRLPATEVGLLTGEPTANVPSEDFIVIQGVADLAVILDRAIWLVDFKTDKPGSGKDLTVEKYSTQLKLYARALSSIYGRPVTECWLHFLASGKTIPVSPLRPASRCRRAGRPARRTSRP
jgi:ATP-dependent helicase/nuclease subunit A